MKIVQCANCGAPLETKRFRKSVTCNYCGVANEEEKLRTLHEEKPKDFVQPKTWKPPADSRAGSRELGYKMSPVDFLPPVMAVSFLLAAAFAGTTQFWLHPFYGVIPADLLRVNVVRSPDDLGKELQGADVSPTQVDARFRTNSAGVFKTLHFDWGSKDHGAPYVISLDSNSAPFPVDVGTRLNDLLHGGIHRGNWVFGPIQIQLREDIGQLSLTIDPASRADLFGRRVAAGFRVLDAAAFGHPLNVDADEMREVFGGGYPVVTLAKIDPMTPTARSHDLMNGLFSGAIVEYNHFTIGLEHPLLPFVEVKWDDEDDKGGRLRYVRFTPSEDFASKRDAFVACLAKTLGPVVTHAEAKGAKDYSFPLAAFPVEAELQLTNNDIVEMHAIDRFPAAKWHDVIAAIDACR